MRRPRPVRAVTVAAFAVTATLVSILTAPESLASADWLSSMDAPARPAAILRVLVSRGEAGIRPAPPAVVQPIETPRPTEKMVTAAAVEAVVAADGQRIYLDALRNLLAEHAPAYATELEMIGVCESGRWDPAAESWYVRPDAIGDGGNSLGWLQIWRGWPAGVGPHLDPLDPVDAIYLAIAIRESRGRFGGGGGWTCADLRGIR